MYAGYISMVHTFLTFVLLYLQVWAPIVSRPSVLVLDSLKTHQMPSMRAKLEEELCTEVEFVPPGITGMAQPIDVAVMHVLKAKCRSLYVKHFLDHDFCVTATERRQLITRTVIEAWASVKPDVIRRGFVASGLVPIGPREADERFWIDEPSDDCQESDDSEESDD